jgi:Tetracyclin repressor-like, C-terminal domain/Bacterial regulatory proteins, tetR family
MVQALSRRDRVRAETTEEIKQTARRILVEQGPKAVTLRAIARDMGVTAPALYRYFDSHEELVRRVVGDIFGELAEEIQAAIEAAGAASGGDPAEKMAAACQGFRQWALTHKAEFALLFGTPLPGVNVEDDDFCEECARRFAGTFYALFLELWRKNPFPVPSPEEIDPGLREQLARYGEGIGADVPLGALLVFLRCWVRLYGIVSMEVFGHLGFALDDPAPIFDITLAELASLVGLQYPPRRTPGGSG